MADEVLTLEMLDQMIDEIKPDYNTLCIIGNDEERRAALKRIRELSRKYGVTKTDYLR